MRCCRGVEDLLFCGALSDISSLESREEDGGKNKLGLLNVT